MQLEDLLKRVNSKNNSDDEWLQLQKDVHIFLQENHQEEEKKYFVPFGYSEMITMICDGIKRKKKN